jgi:hypothetical protein
LGNFPNWRSVLGMGPGGIQVAPGIGSVEGRRTFCGMKGERLCQ